jgi:hypothetical protein
VPLALVWATVIGCEAPAPPPEPAPPHWVYAPGPVTVSLGAPRGRLGRAQAPQRTLQAGITGAPGVPLRLATPFAVPGDGPARAIVYGLEGAQPAIELIEIDAGRVAWRSKECAGPVVGVTAQVTLCADGTEVRALGHDGKRRWRTAGTFLSLTEERVVLAGPGRAIVLDAEDGEELASVPLPRGTAMDTVLASCGDAGRELFATSRDGRLVRIAEAAGGRAITWIVPAGEIAELDACTGDTVLVRVRTEPETALIAIARATGKITGRVDGVRGAWRARDGSAAVEVATASGVARLPRDLAGPAELLALPPLGELIAERGDARLVRATEHTAVILDRGGVRAHLPFAWQGGVLGDGALLGATWTGSPGETVHRLGLPARLRREVRLPRRLAAAPPAELRDLPAATRLDLDAAATGKPDTAMYAVAAAALDPADPAVLYAVTLERPAADARTAGVASVDLATRAWRWQRGDGCGAGAPVGIAVAAAGDVVACAARVVDPRSATVTATSRAGASRWQWEGDNADAMNAAGGVVLVHDADRVIVLDAATGHLRGRLQSDDGAPMRAVAVVVGEATYVTAYERGRLVARLPAAGMLPVWSLAVDGVVRALSPSEAGVLVELEDGDAYRVDLRTAAVAPIPGLGLAWRAPGDLVTGTAGGGPMQLSLYELSGALRARNDYALLPPIAYAFARGPATSPLVLASGPGLIDVLVLEPRDGTPLRRIRLPEAAAARLVFGTIVGGAPVAGVLLASPLRVVVF